MCSQQGHKWACASAQSYQNLPCPHEETLRPWLSKMCPVRILISLRKCAGWSESSLGAIVRRYAFWLMDGVKKIASDSYNHRTQPYNDTKRKNYTNRRTAYTLQTKEMQSNFLPLPNRGDHKTIDDPPNKSIRQQIEQNTKIAPRCEQPWGSQNNEQHQNRLRTGCRWGPQNNEQHQNRLRTGWRWGPQKQRTTPERP